MMRGYSDNNAINPGGASGSLARSNEAPAGAESVSDRKPQPEVEAACDTKFAPGFASSCDDKSPLDIESLLDLAVPDDSRLSEKIRPMAREVLIQIDPRDASERMLAVQMIAAFSRSMFLARYANLQKNAKWFSLYSGECNRAMATFRGQLQTLTDLRRPRRTTFNAIRQANFADQQIVVTDPARTEARP
jgi:hypothetical protein